MSRAFLKSKFFVVNAMLVFAACHDSVNTSAKSIDSTFIKELPAASPGGSRGEYNFNYQYIQRVTDLLQLDSLDGGYDSLAVRVWLGHSMAIKKHVITITRNNNHWKAILVTHDEDDDASKILKISNEVFPKSGWSHFFKLLNESNIINLPNQDHNPDCDKSGHTDGIDYEFEIATTKKYRFYYYCLPEYSPDCSEAKTVLQFAAMLEKEFGFQFIR